VSSVEGLESVEGRVSGVEKYMSQYTLDSFGAYQKANELFDLVVTDMAEVRKDPCWFRLVAQQLSGADSICANIEEGFGRLSRTEYVRFLDFARGSARETRGRYQRMKHWLGDEIIQRRVDLADHIIGILTKSIERLRKNSSARITQHPTLRNKNRSTAES
jgi:four helix bundle protein